MNPIEVMLAEKMDKPIEYYLGWSIEEKTDGIRALIVKENGVLEVYGRNQTKKGRAVFTSSLPEIVDFFSDVDDFILDCELMSKDFLTLQSKVRTTKTVVHDPFFYIKAFDIIRFNGIDVIEMGVTYSDRRMLLLDFISQFEGKKFLKPTVQAPNPLTEEYLEQCLKKITDHGGEGLIIKNPNGLYAPGKRRRDWTKVLPYREMDVVFTNAIIGEGKYKNTLGALEAFACSQDDGVLIHIPKFNVGTGWTDEVRDRIWEKTQEPGFFPIPGKIKMKETYPTGVPRMPVFLSFNVDKEGS